MSQNKRDSIKREVAIKNFRYNRFLWIRYALALFFFANLFWAIFTFSYSLVVGLPIVLLCSACLAALEHMRLYEDHSNNLKYSRIFFLLQTFSNGLIIVMSFFPRTFKFCFPFLLYRPAVLIVLLVVLFVGIIICGLILKLIEEIKGNRDKYYKKIIEYEKNL